MLNEKGIRINRSRCSIRHHPNKQHATIRVEMVDDE